MSDKQYPVVLRLDGSMLEYKLTQAEWDSAGWKDAMSSQRMCHESGLACICGRCGADNPPTEFTVEIPEVYSRKIRSSAVNSRNQLLRLARIDSGRSLDTTAWRLNVTRSSLANYERGIHEPGMYISFERVHELFPQITEDEWNALPELDRDTLSFETTICFITQGELLRKLRAGAMMDMGEFSIITGVQLHALSNFERGLDSTAVTFEHVKKAFPNFREDIWNATPYRYSRHGK